MTALLFRLTHRRKITCCRCAGAGRVTGFMGTDFGTCTRCAGSGEMRV